MRIGIDCLFLVETRTRGTFTYVVELVRRMVDSGEEIVLFLNKDSAEMFAALFPKATIVILPVSGRSRFARVAFQHLFLFLYTKKRCDVLFCPGYVAPLILNVPCVATIHDMQYKDIPMACGTLMEWYYKIFVPITAKRAISIITVSEFSKLRILKHIKIKAEKINVIYEASRFSGRQTTALNEEEMRSKFQIEGPYLLSVSSSSPHKNIARLVEAFRSLVEKRCTKGFSLVFVGQFYNSDDKSAKAMATATKGNVKFLGYVAMEDLYSLYRYSNGFCLASLYEGFGLPIVEAMDNGIPIACADSGSMLEIAGKNAISFNGESVNDIESALNRLINMSETERIQVSSQFRERAARFSWDSAASMTVNIIRDAHRKSLQDSGYALRG